MNIKLKKYQMKISTLKVALYTMLTVVTVSACKKENPTPTVNDPIVQETGKVTIEMNHKWGAIDFELNTEYIHPTTNDQLTFAMFKYYISNFKLKKSDGTWWTHPESYFLVNISNPSTTQFDLTGIPAGTYTEMSFVMGVDSTRNVSGAQTGALSTTNAMFWSWNSGYIMLKAEGQSPQATGGSFAYHLGGFSGVNNIVTQRNVVFGATNLVVTSASNGAISMLVSPATLFTNFGSVSNGNIHMPSHDAKMMADDFYGDVTFDHLHN